MQRIIVLQPARATGTTAAYPDGSAKNETAPGANDGTPFELARSNDIFGMQQAMLHQLGITPSGLAETALLSQFLEGAVRLASVGSLYVDSGAADAYVLTQFGSIQPRLAYYDGMEIVFKAANANAGASTVDVDGLGITAVTQSDGTALAGGEIGAGAFITARYNLASTRFELSQAGVSAAKAQQAAGVATDVSVTPAVQQFHNSAIKAWVSFNGVGTPGILEGYNIASIVDDGVGLYTINFINNFANVKYAVVGSVFDTALPSAGGFLVTAKAIGSVSIRATNLGGTLTDYDEIAFHITGTLA